MTSRNGRDGRGAIALNYKWNRSMMLGESQEAPRGNNGGEAASHVALSRHRVEFVREPYY